MLISLNWIHDYVDLPADLDPVALGEVFTRTTAEVDGVHRIDVGAKGLIAANVKGIGPIPSDDKLRLATLDVGGKTVNTVTSAPKLNIGDLVVYAPPGAAVKALGRIESAAVAGITSAGMILSAESMGIEAAGREAVFLSDEFKPGDELPSELFDDWLIEIDNKSLTNRPDLWGHYGVAREIAAILRKPLNPFAGVSKEELLSTPLPTVEIRIADGTACPRYSAIVLEGLTNQPAPLWMQLRLAHVGQRPISGLVDLTNYIMLDLGQPMHAFDAAKVDRIEVDWAKPGERFVTLDGIERALTKTDLMIQCRGKSVALAGVMGGLETEVSATTTKLLLESANFNGATIRRTAARLGLRSDASARFEKSLDPAHTLLGLRRFVQLARTMYPRMRLAGRLSDAYPNPANPIRIAVDPRHAARTLGREISLAEARDVLAPLGFDVSNGGTNWHVCVPSFRATGDIAIEADVVEELARSMSYDAIEPAMPHVTARSFPINALHELEQRSLEYLATAHGFHEIHGYLWYEDVWLSQLGFDPGTCLELQNPAGKGLHRLRGTLVPGLLAAVARNRFHFDSLSLLELGSVFKAHSPRGEEYRHLGLLLAQRGKNVEAALNERLRSAVAGWAWDRFARPVRFAAARPDSSRPWEDPNRTAELLFDGAVAGRISLVDAALRRRMDEHLAAWGIAWAELHLSALAPVAKLTEKLGAIPPFPLVEEDFSVLVPRTTPFDEVAEKLAGFAHPLLKVARFVTSYEGDEKTGRKRSLTFRCVVGEDSRTLTEADTGAFRGAFEAFARKCGYEIRKA